LDSTTRKLNFPDGREMTLTDTVGFIQKLPTTLVEAFQSTLEEISDSDLILHVIDASSQHIDAHYQAVANVLEQIKANAIPQIVVLNKLDLLSVEQSAALSVRYPQAMLVSASDGQGTAELLARIEQTANAAAVLLEVQIPFAQGALVQLAHEQCSILSENYNENGTALQLRAPQALASKFQPYTSQRD
jgi:GTP-binding protein HflX